MNITVSLSEVVKSLSNGMTWTKKEDIGFGSIEKVFGLTPSNIAELKNHPEMLGLETMIPRMIIVNDIEKEKPSPAINNQSVSGQQDIDLGKQETKVEVKPMYKEVKAEKPVEKVQYEAFI